MTTPMAQESRQRYTFADYLTWNGPVRFELAAGEAVLLASPAAGHQLVLAEIVQLVMDFLEGHPGKAVPAPFDVRLFEREGDEPEDIDTVVQPDISVVCDRTKLDDRGCKGAPDMVIEILSPSSHRHDRITKYDLYQRAGVKEYWIVEPEARTVQVFLRGDKGILLPHESYGDKDAARVHVLDGCIIEMCKVFPEA